jgi:hypothetical protein
MVESIYFLQPAWCGIHPAGLWPEQDFQSVTRATAFQAVVCPFAGSRTIYNATGDAYREPMELLAAQYSWNMRGDGFFRNPK